MKITWELIYDPRGGQGSQMGFYHWEFKNGLELESVSGTNTVGSNLPSASVRMQKSEESTLSSVRSWLCGTKV